MARIKLSNLMDNLNVTETYDIVNAIRNDDPRFEQYVPLANADNVTEVGAAIQLHQTLQNDFINTLIDRIGLVVVNRLLLKNPLAKFKKGFMDQGRTIEEIFTDLVKEQKYDPEGAETTVFKRAIPNVKVLFHERNRESMYETTISDDQLASAFVSWDKFGEFIASIVSTLYNSAEVDEYKYMKLLIDNYHSKGLFKQIKVDKPNTSTATKEFVKKLRAMARRMTISSGSREYNSLAVHTRSDMQDLHLFIDADLEAELDVDVLANAFNMNRTDWIGHVTVIDNFASQGLEAVLVDESFFMVYDNKQKLETIRNPKGLYWNYFFHIWQTLSVSRFANAVAFVSGDVKPVTQVIVDPAILAMKPDRSFAYTAYVRQTDDATHDIAWSVEGYNGSTVQAGTTVDENGVLKVAINQTGELIVKATVTYSVDVDGTPTNETVYGQSIVTIIQ